MGRKRNPSSSFLIFFFGSTDMRVVHIYVYPESFPVEAIINIIQFHLSCRSNHLYYPIPPSILS
jgi:hypothetical protein